MRGGMIGQKWGTGEQFPKNKKPICKILRRNRVKFQIRWCFSLVTLALFCACAPVTMNQFIAKGKKPLVEKQIQNLVKGKTLHLQAIDFDAKVKYLPNGHLTATSLQEEKDTGKWSITSDNQLCMKFSRWYFGDQKCYILFEEKGDFVFFTPNGARYYTATATPENYQGNENGNHFGQGQNKGNVSDNDTDNESTVSLSEAEKKEALRHLARNCPGCNFTGADLQGAQLAGANLAGANLSRVDLSDANLRRANLAGANLSGANLVRTNLAGADLTNSDLSDADFTGSNLIRANVTGAKLDDALFTGAHLESIQGLKK